MIHWGCPQIGYPEIELGVSANGLYHQNNSFHGKKMKTYAKMMINRGFSDFPWVFPALFQHKP